jgi:hypothetical protein
MAERCRTLVSANKRGLLMPRGRSSQRKRSSCRRRRSSNVGNTTSGSSGGERSAR